MYLESNQGVTSFDLQTTSFLISPEKKTLKMTSDCFRIIRIFMNSSWEIINFSNFHSELRYLRITYKKKLCAVNIIVILVYINLVLTAKV